MEPVDQEDQEELVVLAEQEVMVGLADQVVQAAAEAAAAQEHILTVKVIVIVPKQVEVAVLVLLAELEVSASRQAVQAVPELQTQAARVVLRTLVGPDRAAAEEI